MQTAHRESIASRKRTEVEKFKGKLKESELDEKSRVKDNMNKLTSAVKLETEKMRTGRS